MTFTAILRERRGPKSGDHVRCLFPHVEAACRGPNSKPCCLVCGVEVRRFAQQRTKLSRSGLTYTLQRLSCHPLLLERGALAGLSKGLAAAAAQCFVKSRVQPPDLPDDQFPGSRECQLSSHFLFLRLPSNARPTFSEGAVKRSRNLISLGLALCGIYILTKLYARSFFLV